MNVNERVRGPEMVGVVTRELALAAVQPPAPAARLNMVLRCRGGGGNDRIPGQEEVLEYTSTGRRPRIQYNSDPGRQTPFWLCPECGNMLYPKENAATKTLQRVCRNCQHTDAAERNLVFVNDQRPPNVSAEVTADVTKDPTLPRTHQCICTNCQHTEAVFFQAVTRGDEGMKLIFMCTKCANTSPLPPNPTFARGDEWQAADASVPDVSPAGVRTDGCNSARVAT